MELSQVGIRLFCPQFLLPDQVNWWGGEEVTPAGHLFTCSPCHKEMEVSGLEPLTFRMDALSTELWIFRLRPRNIFSGEPRNNAMLFRSTFK